MLVSFQTKKIILEITFTVCFEGLDALTSKLTFEFEGGQKSIVRLCAREDNVRLHLILDCLRETRSAPNGSAKAQS
jgi:hypothetical protein